MAAASSLALATASLVATGAGGRNNAFLPSKNKTPNLFLNPNKTTSSTVKAVVSSSSCKRPYPKGDASLFLGIDDVFGKDAVAGHDNDQDAASGQEMAADDMLMPFFWIFGKEGQQQEAEESSDDMLMPFFWIFGKEGQQQEAESSDDMLLPFFWIFGKEGQQQEAESSDDMLMPFFWIFGKQQQQQGESSDDMLMPFFWVFGKQGDNNKGDAVEAILKN
nr:linusorb A1-A3 precursor protein G14-170N [Linum usitatissimum]FAA04139.1 TPA: Linusorb A1-A3 precursor protein G14-170N [Linum usitatissimum]